jgi:hypothetical protein
MAGISAYAEITQSGGLPARSVRNQKLRPSRDCAPELRLRAGEGDAAFIALELGHQSRLKLMFEAVSPRLVRNVLQPARLCRAGWSAVMRHSSRNPDRSFFAGDIIYGLRNALFHGSLTPSEQNNEVYEPAYHLVMRLVRCTI